MERIYQKIYMYRRAVKNIFIDALRSQSVLSLRGFLGCNRSSCFRSAMQRCVFRKKKKNSGTCVRRSYANGADSDTIDSSGEVTPGEGEVDSGTRVEQRW